MGCREIFHAFKISLYLSYGRYYEQNVSGVLSDDNWKRFDDRAGKVRRLTWGEEGIISGNALPTILTAQLFRGDNKHDLFPNLSCLACTIGEEQDLLQIIPFLSSYLTSLHIEIPDITSLQSEGLSELLRSLQLWSPSITDFGIHYKFIAELLAAPLFENIFQFLEAYPHIEHLKTTESVFLVICGRLPILSTLRSLHIQMAHCKDNGV
jgi:hypothetical protein